MRKVGIFTIYIANYGAVLQTYALQRYLRDTYQDLEVYVVDFYTHAPYAIFKKASNNPVKNLIKQGTRLIHYSELRRRNKREKSFIHEEFLLSSRFETVKDLMENMPKYDIYLTGSDQVFNTKSKYSSLFYQRFNSLGGIKAAYAPSFGTSTFPEEYKQSIIEPLKDFSFISCREDDGAAMLSELLGKHIPSVIDPTLLLAKEQWEKMMVVPRTNVKYLLVYDLNGGPKMIDIALKIAKKKGLSIWCITQHTEIRYKGIDRLIFDAGPREFVGLFAKAQYVVTDSFHGTSFSVIFEKEFSTYIAIPRASRRIVSLLSKVGLESRIVYPDIDNSIAANVGENGGDKSAFIQLKDESMKYIRDIVTA